MLSFVYVISNVQLTDKASFKVGGNLLVGGMSLGGFFL